MSHCIPHSMLRAAKQDGLEGETVGSGSHPHPVEERDGEPLFSTLFDDHYFSRHDGLAETEYVFHMGNDLEARLSKVSDASSFRIGELGFGTGLNFLATWALWRSVRTDGAKLCFTSVEGFPITADQASRAHEPWDALCDLSGKLIAHWDQLSDGVWLDAQTYVRVVMDEAEAALGQFEPDHNAWFLDGFSPAKNPTMWSLPLMQKLAENSAKDATLASYTAAGWVRRNLEQAGFMVSQKKGFGTKRHMIVGHLSTPKALSCKAPS